MDSTAASEATGHNDLIELKPLVVTVYDGTTYIGVGENTYLKMTCVVLYKQINEFALRLFKENRGFRLYPDLDDSQLEQIGSRLGKVTIKLDFTDPKKRFSYMDSIEPKTSPKSADMNLWFNWTLLLVFFVLAQLVLRIIPLSRDCKI